MEDKLKNKKWLEKRISLFPVRHIAREMGVPYSRAYKAVKDFGIEIPKRNGYIYSEESRRNKSLAQKIAYKRKYPNGRFGSLHPNWKGGRRTAGHSGYVCIYAPDHPRANGGAVFEHILVAEKKLGRPLRKGEVVHHINHVRDDNRPENLEVVKRGQHVKNHFNEPIELRKRIKYLEGLLKDNNIDMI